MALERVYIPLGDWLPDLGWFANPGLRVADGVVPIHGDYIAQPLISQIASLGLGAGETAAGMDVAAYNGNGYVLVKHATYADIKEITEAGVVTNRTRTAANNYAAASDFLDGCSFGDSAVCTVWSDATPSSSEPTQYLAAGAARFANMVTSTFEPRGKFCFAFRNNLFLANCYVPGAFDTLTNAHHPRLVVWSQTDNIRVFGSFGVTPEFTGSGFQQLHFDIGDIVDAVSGNDYAIIACTGGLVRVEGPPYTFRVVARGRGCIATNAITIAGNDVYYLDASGLVRLVGGEGEPETLGIGKFARWLMDTSTVNVGQDFARPLDVQSAISLRHDPVNNLLLLTYRPFDSLFTGLLWYNISEDRASGVGLETQNAILYVRARPPASLSSWSPGRDLRFVSSGTGYSRFALGNSGTDVNLRRGYLQLNPKLLTRIVRVRPIYYSRGQSVQPSLSVTVESIYDPNAQSASSGAQATFSNGWITTPSTRDGDLHDVRFRMAANSLAHYFLGFRGFECEYTEGGTS